jgi:hypothetical protein
VIETLKGGKFIIGGQPARMRAYPLLGGRSAALHAAGSAQARRESASKSAVTGEALTEDSLHHEGFVLTHSVRVEEQSYAVMLLTKPSQPGSVQPATEIGKGKGNAQLTRDIANLAAGFDDFMLGVRPRKILEPAMAATVRADRKAVRL